MTDNPGLSEDEFYGLFVKCDLCGHVMTRFVFGCHLKHCTGDDGNGGDTEVESEQEV